VRVACIVKSILVRRFRGRISYQRPRLELDDIVKVDVLNLRERVYEDANPIEVAQNKI
jgi:hypothetical protein